MHSHNLASTSIITNYCSSVNMNAPNFQYDQDSSASSSNQLFGSHSGNNNVSSINNNSKPVSKISGSYHGKHSSLYEKQPGSGQLQQQQCLRLPSIGQISGTKGLMINPLSPNDCDSLFDTENRFINSCSSAQQKKRIIRVQSKNKFPSDFFNENGDQTQVSQQNNESSSNPQINYAKCFQSPTAATSNNINFSSQQRNLNQNMNPHQFSQLSLENSGSMKQFDIYTQQQYLANNDAFISPQSRMYEPNREFISTPQDNNQFIQRPFISAMAQRSTKSPSLIPQQITTPLNQKKIEFQLNKNNFIEQQNENTLNTQALSNNIQNSNSTNSQVKNINSKQIPMRNNLSTSGSVKRLISAQIQSAVISPCDTFRITSPKAGEKQSRLVSPSQQNNQIILNKMSLIQKQNIPLQPQHYELRKKNQSSIQEIDMSEIRSCTKELSIPNSPKNSMNTSATGSVQKNNNNNNSNNNKNSEKKRSTESGTPDQIQNQKNIQQHPISQQSQRQKPNSNLKRTPNYDVKSSANIHEAINKGSFSCKAPTTTEKKDKLFTGQQKERKDPIEHAENQLETSANKFISRKPVVVNKPRGGNIDFTNFKMPISTMNRKIKEISGLQNPNEKSHKSSTVIVASSSKSKLDISATAAAASSSSTNNDLKKKKVRALSQTKLPTQAILQSDITPQSLKEVPIEESIEDLQIECVKEEQTYEGDNSDTTKNSIQQNNTISLNSPSIQHDNPYLFSDKQIQSTQNSMVALPPPQLKHFYSDCCETSSFNQIQSPTLNYHNPYSQPHQMNARSDENIFNLNLSHKTSQQNISQNNNSNQYNNNNNHLNHINEFIQDQDHNIQHDTSNTNGNNYNKTANFNGCKDTFNNISPANNIQKLKSSQKALPKIALNFKESEKYKPFLIRKVSSQCSMRVKPCSLNNYSSNSTSSSYSNNIIFDFNKNGSASTTNGKSLISTPTLLASNEYINSHEFSFSNQ